MNKRPGSYEIKIPNYYGERTMWRDARNAAWRQLDAFAEELSLVVADDALPIEQRVSALGLMKNLGADLAVRRLMNVVDLVDERGVFFAEEDFGRHPVVTVLASYGRSMQESVIYRAVHEEDAERRNLFCEVLVKGLGPELAEREVSKFARSRNNASPARFVEEVRQEISRLAQMEK